MKSSDLTITTYTVASASPMLEDVVMKITHNPTGLEVDVERPCNRKNKRLAELKLKEMVNECSGKWYIKDVEKHEFEYYSILPFENELAEIINAVGPVEITDTGCKFKARFTDNFKGAFGSAGPSE